MGKEGRWAGKGWLFGRGRFGLVAWGGEGEGEGEGLWGVGRRWLGVDVGRMEVQLGV